VVAKDLTTLCEEADVAFVGTVADVRSQWADPEQQRIETLATFAQLTPLYGDPGEEITLRFPGGEIEGMREEVAGLPRFRSGERVVLLVRRAPAVSPIAGFHQGLFRVMDGPGGPQVQYAGTPPLFGGSGASLDARSPDAAAENTVPLETFLNVLRHEFDRKQEGR
jgi:hypothetical protein